MQVLVSDTYHLCCIKIWGKKLRICNLFQSIKYRKLISKKNVKLFFFFVHSKWCLLNVCCLVGCLLWIYILACKMSKWIYCYFFDMKHDCYYYWTSVTFIVQQCSRFFFFKLVLSLEFQNLGYFLLHLNKVNLIRNICFLIIQYDSFFFLFFKSKINLIYKILQYVRTFRIIYQ